MQLIQTACVMLVSQTMMMLRVYAMSSRNRFLLVGLTIIIVAEVVFSIVLMALPGNHGLSLVFCLRLFGFLFVCVFRAVGASRSG
jgi:hypothetical protein